MNILDNQSVFKSYQKFKTDQSIADLPEQISEAFAAWQKARLPLTWLGFKNIVVIGMGGSNLASEVALAVFQNDLKIPLILWRDYGLPGWVGKNTLVIAISYSGQTEETINGLNEAIKRRAKIFCLATGGQIIALAKKHRLPYCQLSLKHNPSLQPRLGIGSQLGAILALLNKLKLIKLSGAKLNLILADLKKQNQLFLPTAPSAKNKAKNLAQKFFGFAPLIISADFLGGNGHVLVNQINESAKNLAESHVLPEMNHHLLEALELPAAALKNFKVLILNSRLYPVKIQQRIAITKKVLNKKKIAEVEYLVKGDDKLAAALAVLLLGSWLSFYLAVLNKKDPNIVPWVKYFKEELRKAE